MDELKKILKLLPVLKEVEYNTGRPVIVIVEISPIVAHLSLRSARNTMGTRGTRSDAQDLWRHW